jgi:hypothetical protein
MNNIAILSLALLTLLTSCTKYEHKDIVGLWAMIPLVNGIANVIEYTEGGKSINHAFKCGKDKAYKSYKPFESDFYIDDNSVLIKNYKISMNLEIVNLDKDTMILADSDSGMIFSYTRVNTIEPNCKVFWDEK